MFSKMIAEYSLTRHWKIGNFYVVNRNTLFLNYNDIIQFSLYPIVPRENNILFSSGHDIVGLPHTDYAEFLLTEPI